MYCSGLLVSWWMGRAGWVCVCDACLPQDYKSENYKLEKYWTRKTIGFRQRKGDKQQLFSIGGPNCELSMDTLLGWADEVLKRLDKSKSWQQVREWVRGEINKGA